MDGVIPSEAKLIGKLSGPPSQSQVNAEQVQLAQRRLEVLERLAVSAGRETLRATRGADRGAALGVAEDA